MIKFSLQICITYYQGLYVHVYLVDAEFLQKLGKLFNRAEQKELVDPYAVVNFAGHKGRTATVMEDMTPEWNEQINLGVRVGVVYPSVAIQ